MIGLQALTVEHAREPVGVDVRPRFGWNVVVGTNGARQLSWSIEVRCGEDTAWNSGVVTDERCSEIEYAGAPLESLRRYSWTLRVETSVGTATSSSSFVTGILDGDWRGSEWIGSPRRDDPAAPLLRHGFTLAEPAVEAYLAVGAGGLAHVELDGEPLDDTVLGPGFTDYDVVSQYTVVDVTDRLGIGSHMLGAELGRGFYGMRGRNTWNWETAPWHADPCVRMLLLVRTSSGERIVATSADWQVTDGPTTFDDLYAGEDHDARRRIPCWSRNVEDHGDWSPAAIVDGPRGRAVHQRQPDIRVAETLEPVTVTELSPGRWVASFDRVIAGWADITATGPSGSTVELRFGESLQKDGTPNCVDEKGYFDGRFQMDRLVLDGSTVRWRPRFVWHGFQHVEIRAEELPRIRAQRVHTTAERTGRFSSDSALLDRIHELTVRTVLNNLHGLPTDTPKYEKNGWTGDGMLGAQLMLQNLDVHELLAKWSLDIAHSRHGEGAPEVIAPHGGWRMDWTPAPTWHAALLLVPWEIHLHTGDVRILADVWPDASDYLRFELGRCPDGIAQTTLGDWVSPETDPGGGNAPEDTRVAATAYLIAMCDAAARIAAALDEDPAEWVAAGRRSRDAFVAAFWDDASDTVRGRGDEGYRQAHTVLALAFDVLPEHVRSRAADRLASDVRERDGHLGTGALATKYILPVLTRFGHAEAAWTIATQTTFPSWGFWIAQGATSLWEHWHPASRSRGHYFLGTIDDWLYRDVAGLAPLEPGWRRARVAPRILGCGVRTASTAVRTPYGELAVSWQEVGSGVELRCVVPVGITVEVELPGLRRELKAGRHTLRS
ncbi:family 78 glycoside hydrolase catalytic domain [Microbacterium sp. NPDC055903]